MFGEGRAHLPLRGEREVGVGKAKRVRTGRLAAERAGSTQEAGAAFGIGPGGRVPVPSGPARSPRPPAVRESEEFWAAARSARERVADGLVRLTGLAADRVAARRTGARLDEEISVVVEHLRVDGASWAEVGRALGISRQGARQTLRAHGDQRDS